jgi:AcrR family transcriptional regulator
MSQDSTLLEITARAADQDSAKRRQIVAGAMQVFLTHGFDAASMGEIAKAAGVSKGTLYVYFKDKEALFDAIVGEVCVFQAENVFAFDPEDHDVATVLTRLGMNYVRLLCQPDRWSPVRAIIAIADRMPEMGRRFYEAGPAKGTALLSAYLKAQADAGALSDLDDAEVAAAQFMEACHATLYKPVIFNFGPAPSEERIAHVVGLAVRMFMAAYGPKDKR